MLGQDWQSYDVIILNMKTVAKYRKAMLKKPFTLITAALLALGSGCSKSDSDADAVSVAAEETTKKQITDDSLENQMIGFWAADVDKSLDEILKKVPDQKEETILFFKGMLETTLVEITNDKIIATAFGKDQGTENYKTMEVNETTGNIDLNLWGGKEEEGYGSATIKKDSLSLVRRDKPALVLNRITEEEFNERMTASQKNPFPGK